MDSTEVISWTRLAVLFGALGIAAWLDHKDRRVPNNFWIRWSKPAIFLWTLDLLVAEAEWYVFATAAGIVNYKHMYSFHMQSYIHAHILLPTQRPHAVPAAPGCSSAAMVPSAGPGEPSAGGLGEPSRAIDRTSPLRSR